MLYMKAKGAKVNQCHKIVCILDLYWVSRNSFGGGVCSSAILITNWMVVSTGWCWNWRIATHWFSEHISLPIFHWQEGKCAPNSWGTAPGFCSVRGIRALATHENWIWLLCLQSSFPPSFGALASFHLVTFSVNVLVSKAILTISVFYLSTFRIIFS